jgi:hypothetical protein
VDAAGTAAKPSVDYKGFLEPDVSHTITIGNPGGGVSSTQPTSTTTTTIATTTSTTVPTSTSTTQPTVPSGGGPVVVVPEAVANGAVFAVSGSTDAGYLTFAMAKELTTNVSPDSGCSVRRTKNQRLVYCSRGSGGFTVEVTPAGFDSWLVVDAAGTAAKPSVDYKGFLEPDVSHTITIGNP